MNNQMEPQTLEDVLDEFVATGPSPNIESLAEFIRRYPEHERELTEFAASWTLMTSLPPSPASSEVDEETLVLRGMSVVQNLLYQQGQVQAATAAEGTMPIASLLEEGRSHGLDPRRLAQATGLGQVVLRKLDRRLIRYASVPREAVDAIAAAVQQNVESVVRYLQQRPTFAAAAQHRAEQAPELAEPEDFFAAVQADPTMTPEQRSHWLELDANDRR